jgi:hypothetical protein
MSKDNMANRQLNALQDAIDEQISMALAKTEKLYDDIKINILKNL